MSTIIRSLLLSFFPHRCISCGVTIQNDYHFICDSCRDQIQPLNNLSVNKCVSCSRPLLNKEIEKCYQCHLSDLPLFYNTSLFSYQDVVIKDLYKKFKFESSLKAGSDFYMLIKDQLLGEINTLSPDIVCPVPVSPRTRRTRGFNQVEYILHRAGIGFQNLLSRKNHHNEQNKLNFQERLQQIRGQFVLKKKHITLKGRKILLIDDIYTTGSTVGECSHILRQAGAKSIQTLSFLRS